MSLLEAARTLRDACDGLAFTGVPYVYNPLAYAWEAHERYTRKYGMEPGPRRALLLGMNPGPWGMGQTGVPFGDVAWVRDWMGIHAKASPPAKVHPKRPVLGFDSKRREPSGNRLYGWADARWGSADSFFGEFYITNYCPLLFFNDAGTNLTPPQLRKSETSALYDACDRHLVDVVRALRPEYVVGVGTFAEGRAREVVETHRLKVKVGSILHPSPASPLANKDGGWAPKAEAQLKALGVLR